MRFLKNVITAALICFTSTQALGEESASEHFIIPTLDKLSSLSGQIDLPASLNEKFPLVVMVPGTGLFDRNVEFGNSGTDEDLIFKSLANDLNKLGFAVLRYDYRGVRCGRKTAPVCESCKTPQERREHFIRSCLDNEVRRLVTPENTREDIRAVYRHGSSHSRVEPSKIIVFGHSEGSLNLSYLLKDNLIQPKAAVFMGGLAESPASVIQWQMIGRFTDAMMEMDSNRDGFVANEEIKASHSRSRLNNFPLDYLLSPKNDRWEQSALLQWRNSEYEVMRSDALAKADHEPFVSGGIVQASYRWWKMFFTDNNHVIENISNYKGPVVYCNGDIDAQTDFQRQKKLVDKADKDFGLNVRIELFTKTGHALGDDPIFGPLTIESKNKILGIFAEFR